MAFWDVIPAVYPDFWGIVRRVANSPDAVESAYSIALKEFSLLAQNIRNIEEFVHPELFEDTGFTEGDYQARMNLVRCKQYDYLLPPEG
jgi:hypothetical protein